MWEWEWLVAFAGSFKLAGLCLEILETGSGPKVVEARSMGSAETWGLAAIFPTCQLATRVLP